MPMAKDRTKPAPAYLSDRTRAIWRKTAPDLTFGANTSDLLAVYCEAVAEYESIVPLLSPANLVITTATGYVQPNPLIAIRNKAADKIGKFAKLLQLANVKQTTQSKLREVEEKLFGK